MQIRVHQRVFLLFAVFAALFISAGRYSAHTTVPHKASWIVHELKTGHYNNQILINGNNPIQLVNYRTVKQSHFVKILLLGIFNLLVSLEYLKYTLRSINSEYARFLKLLLFPNHVFW
jgi:hypothetical protein